MSNWTPEQDKILIESLEDGLSFGQLYGCRELKGFTRNACIGRYRRLVESGKNKDLCLRKDKPLIVKPKPDRVNKFRKPDRVNKFRISVVGGTVFTAFGQGPEITDLPVQELSVGEGKDIFSLEADDCRYLISDTLSCGGKIEFGSYCKQHAKLSYHNYDRVPKSRFV